MRDVVDLVLPSSVKKIKQILRAVSVEETVGDGYDFETDALLNW